MKTYFLFFFLLFSAACETPVAELADEREPEAEQKEKPIFLTHEQIRTAGIVLGRPGKQLSGERLKVTGRLDVPPQYRASLTAPMAGFIKKADKIPGDHVSKGAILAVLEHPTYIDLQEEYLRLKAETTFEKAELDRQETLAKGDAGILKELETARRNFQIGSVHISALAQKLKMLGIDYEQLTAKNIRSEIAVRAPFDGFVTEMNTQIGRYVQPQEELYRFINKEHLHLELEVFEKDINKIKVGQKLQFRIPAWEKEVFEGEIFRIGQVLNAETQTVDVHAHIEGHDERFKPGMFAEANVTTGTESAEMVPEDAVGRREGQNYIFEVLKKDKKGVYFVHKTVKPAFSANGFISIGSGDKELIISGLSYIAALAWDDGGGHHHH